MRRIKTELGWSVGTDMWSSTPIVELIITYPGIRIPLYECMVFMQARISSWPESGDSSPVACMSQVISCNSRTRRQEKRTEVRMTSETHIDTYQLGELRWKSCIPRIEALSSGRACFILQEEDASRTRIQENDEVSVEDESAVVEKVAIKTNAATKTEIKKRYALEAQLRVGDKHAHLGYMAPPFNTKDEAAEFYHIHYPELRKMTSETGWKSDDCPDEGARYVIRVYTDETLTLNMRNVSAFAKAFSQKAR